MDGYKFLTSAQKITAFVGIDLISSSSKVVRKDDVDIVGSNRRMG
jgi:hypothetical protein